MGISLTSFAQEETEVYNYASDDIKNECFKIPVIRRINGGTIIKIEYEGTWPTEMKGAFEYACKIWEEQLPPMLPINIKASIGNIRGSGARTTLSKINTTGYIFADEIVSEYTSTSPQIKNVILEEYVCDSPLKYVVDIPDSTFFDSPDIHITYNKNLLSEFSFSLYETPTDKYDFVTVAMRDIAKGLGIACNLQYANGVLAGRREKPTNYEVNIYSLLSDHNGNLDINKATSGSVALESLYGQPGQLYAPEDWETGVSLNWFIPDSTFKLSRLLSYDFGKGTVIRDISDSNLIPFFYNVMSWGMVETSSIGGGGVTSTGSTSNFIPYEGTRINLLESYGAPVAETQHHKYLSSNQALYTPRPTKVGSDLTFYDQYYDYMWPYHYAYRRNLNMNDTRKRSGYSVCLLKKDGKWDSVFYTTLDEGEIITDMFEYHYDADAYARTCDGYLRCRITRSESYSYFGESRWGYNSKYYVIDAKPQKVEMSFSGVVDNIPTSRSSIDDYFKTVKIGIKNLEGTERIVVERTIEGDRVPTSFEIEDFKNGYFTAIVDKEYYTEFRVIAYNKNGSTQSEVYELAPLEPWEENISLQIQGNSLYVNSNTLRSNRLDSKLNYEIHSVSSYSVDKSLCGSLNNIYGVIDISELKSGLYIFKYIDRKGIERELKFYKHN